MAKITKKAQLEQFKKNMRDQWWRLNNLYWIVNKEGKRVKFRMKPTQERLFKERWYNNVILKSRQHGFTTFIDLLGLDFCLFTDDYKFGIIAHNLDDAGIIFRDKIKFPYENLPEQIKKMVSASTDRAGEMVFSNGSSVRVSTSYRSGTLQLLHVSEYGKISVKYPDKAKEIKTGAFEAVGQGSMIFVESTAEGREGEFFTLCDRARKKKAEGVTLSKMDFKFFFVPWFEEKTYRTSPKAVYIPKEMEKYFEELEVNHGIFLDAEQRAWYAAKSENLGDDIKREHPSTPDEAFESSVDGAYYGTVMLELRKHGKLTTVPHDINYEVNTCWDLGRNDTTDVWFFQKIGAETRLIDFYENSGETMAHYAGVIKKRSIDYGYTYGTHYMPHDIKVTDYTGDGRSRLEIAESLGIKPIEAVRRAKGPDELAADIEITRGFLSTCLIDKKNCDRGISALDNYRKTWNDSTGAWMNRPLHNWASNAADALRTGAVGVKLSVSDGYVPESYIVPEMVAEY